MDNYTRVYDNVMSDEKCQQLIDMFESDTENHQTQDCGSGATLTQINLLHSPDTIWKEETKFLCNVIIKSAQQYRKDCDIKDNQWPSEFAFEPPKIKRYMPNGQDRFPDHVDVLDYKTARRFLVSFIYLDDNEAGHTLMRTYGENIAIPCRKGSVLFFPPFWPWLHAGRKPVDRPKYIIGSYLHYV